MRQVHVALHVERIRFHHLSEGTLSALLVALVVSDQTLVKVSSLLLGKFLCRLQSNRQSFLPAFQSDQRFHLDEPVEWHFVSQL